MNDNIDSVRQARPAAARPYCVRDLEGKARRFASLTAAVVFARLQLRQSWQGERGGSWSVAAADTGERYVVTEDRVDIPAAWSC